MEKAGSGQKGLKECLVGTTVSRVLQDDFGEVTLVDFMGGDLATVNGARQSYGNKSEEFSERDARLTTRLADDQHHTPFRHTYFTLHVVAPEFIARQWYKHQVGGTYSGPGFVDQPWSEFSQRYKEVPPRFYVPRTLRGQSAVNHQASEGKIADHELEQLMSDAPKAAMLVYSALLAGGVAREQARLVLPLSVYTEFTWTCSLQALVHFCVLRDDHGAQEEIREYARVIGTLCRPLAPTSWAALQRNHPVNLQKREALLLEERYKLNMKEPL